MIQAVFCLFCLSSLAEVPHSPTKPTASLSEIPEGDNLVVSHEDQSVPTVTNDDQSDQVVTDQQTVTTGDKFFTPLDHTDLPHCSTPLPLQGRK